MDTYNSKYYEPLEQMMAIRHQYMSKILRDHSGQDIYEFFSLTEDEIIKQIKKIV